MIDPHNPDYGVSKLYALRAYLTNALNFDGRSTRSEYWWLLPFLWLFEILTFLTIGNRILPQLTVRAFLLIPTAAITARRYRDAGFVPGLAIAQTLFTYGTWWLMYANASGSINSGLIWAWLLTWVISQVAKLVMTLMPTQQATAVVTQSQAIAAYRAQHHLSADELQLFRDTMSTLKMQILKLGAQSRSSETLGKIMQATGGLHAVQELFRELMAHPHALTEHADFLYKMLPALIESCDQYLTAEQAEVGTASVNAAITEMASGIQRQAEAIAADYARVVTTDAEEVTAHG